MPEPLILFSTGCFYRTSILEILGPVRDAGFTALEVSSNADHLDPARPSAVERVAARIEALGMEVVSVHAPFSPEIDLTAPQPARREQSLAVMLEAVDAAAALHARHIVVHPAGVDAPVRPEERLARLARCLDGMERIAERCRGRGVKLAIENAPPDLLCSRSGELLWLLGEMRAVQAEICFDVGHANVTGRLQAAASLLAPHMGLVHAHDNNGRGDDHLPPGSGQIDWSELLGLLLRRGFSGGIVIELVPELGDVPALLGAAQRGRRLLREVLRDIDLEAHTPPRSGAPPVYLASNE